MRAILNCCNFLPGILLASLCCLLVPVKGYMVENGTTAMMYLERFGYISQEDMPPGGEIPMKEATPMLMAFQKMCGISQTGELDNKTLDMMNTPRCGNPDMVRVPLGSGSDLSDLENDLYAPRFPRYTVNVNGGKWTSPKVSYRLSMFSAQMRKSDTVTEAQVLEAIHTAFKLWSEVTNLDFVHKPVSGGRGDEKVDIELTFTSREHPQDGFPFDGPGRVLAHAFPPGRSPISGDVHFEDEENWHVHSPKGTDVLFVATHEIGHALGLSHSAVKGAIMAAFYGGYRPKLRLHQDDIDGIQKIYGKREVQSRDKPERIQPPTTRATTMTTPAPTRATTRMTTPKATTTAWTPRTTTELFKKFDPWKSPKISPVGGRPDLCQDARIDAITTLGDGKIYLFKGSYVFQISERGDGVVPGWPNHIGAIFPGLETSLDAAATRENGKTYFFKGAKYWRFTGTRMDSGYPKEIAKHFPGIPDNLDAAFVWFGQFYFTKGDKFWRFDPKSKPHVQDFYPLSTTAVWGLGSGMDAAFTAPNKELFFFMGSQYYRLDSRTFKIADSSPPYPRSSRISWFGCKAFFKRPDLRTVRKLSRAPLIGEYLDDEGY